MDVRVEICMGAPTHAERSIFRRTRENSTQNQATAHEGKSTARVNAARRSQAKSAQTRTRN
jgi:hypothetical protein